MVVEQVDRVLDKKLINYIIGLYNWNHTVCTL